MKKNNTYRMHEETVKELKEKFRSVGMDEEATVKKVMKLIWKSIKRFPSIEPEQIEVFAILGVYEAIEHNTKNKMSVKYMESWILKSIFDNTHEEFFQVYFDRNLLKVIKMVDQGEDIAKISRKTGYTENFIKELVANNTIRKMSSLDEDIIKDGTKIGNAYENIPYYDSISFNDRSSVRELGSSNWNSGLPELYYSGLDFNEVAIYNNFKDQLPVDLLEILELLEEGYKKSEVAEKLGISNACVTRKINKIIIIAKQNGFDL